MAERSQTDPRFTDDIPEARRESLQVSSGQPWWKWLKRWLGFGLLGLLGVGLAIGGLIWMPQLLAGRDGTDPGLNQAESVESGPGRAQVDGEGNDLTESDRNDRQESASLDPERRLLNHRAYAEAPLDSLVAVTADGLVTLRQPAANQLRALIAQARQDGVMLRAVSGFRSIEDQRYLFFEVKAERGESPTRRAEVSAPPGYSEHHTGYAVDLADANQPETDLDESFDGTPAFGWLSQNAAFYGFELSFPEGNEQGVSYEPWHWRFVGDQTSLETFYGDGADAADTGLEQ
jgi:D-alanyl-D-alanine carboxypeptidase